MATNSEPDTGSIQPDSLAQLLLRVAAPAKLTEPGDDHPHFPPMI